MAPEVSIIWPKQKMPTPNLTPTSDVKYLKGVGPARAEILASRGIKTVEDLLDYAPFRYEDRTRLVAIASRIRDVVFAELVLVVRPAEASCVELDLEA